MTAEQRVLDPVGVVERLKAGEPIKLLRQSTIGSSLICVRRAGYDMRPGRPRKSGEARCVGTSYHAGLEYLYRRFMDNQDDLGFATDPRRSSVHQAARDSFDAEAELFEFWPSGKDVAWKRVTDLLDTYVNDQHYWSPDHFDMLGVEQEWFLPLDGEWFIKGSIDLVLRRKADNAILLADHKTAGRKWDQKKHLPQKQVQAPVYCWAWWRLTGETPAAMYFDVMTYKGDFDRRECLVEPRHMEAVLRTAIGVAGIYDNVPLEWLPGNTSSNLCTAVYCDWYAECPYGAALDSVAA